jgi:preprotein translocase subunit SecF
MSGWTRLVRGETTIDFIPWWRRALIVSGLLVLLSVVSLFVRGLNLGIDFEGGVSWEVLAPDVSVGEAREALAGDGLADAKIQIVGEETLRVQGPEMPAEQVQEVRATLGELTGSDASEVSVSTVGASWGGDITESAVRALLLFFVAILIYLSIRLEWRMAVAAVIAVVHDIIISVGVYSIFQFEVTPGTVIAFLTILGYSIYDTIVVDDKVKENEHLVGLTGRMTYTQMVNRSMNQVLLRSLNTSVTTLLPVIALLVVGAGIMGAVTLREFSVALFVGLSIGMYSSIFVAAPVLVWLKEREPKNRTVRERLAASGAPLDGLGGTPRSAIVPEPTTDEPARADGAAGASDVAPRPMPRAPAGPAGAIPPRPRKKGKRR